MSTESIPPNSNPNRSQQSQAPSPTPQRKGQRRTGSIAREAIKMTASEAEKKIKAEQLLYDEHQNEIAKAKEVGYNVLPIEKKTGHYVKAPQQPESFEKKSGYKLMPPKDSFGVYAGFPKKRKRTDSPDRKAMLPQTKEMIEATLKKEEHRQYKENMGINSTGYKKLPENAFNKETEG